MPIKRSLDMQISTKYRRTDKLLMTWVKMAKEAIIDLELTNNF